MDKRVEKVENTMQLIGGRWRPAIMFILITMGTKRFSEIFKLIPGINQRMLAKQLRDLEAAGLISRAFFESIPPRVEYSVTPLGATLEDIYKQICQWTEQNTVDK
jgi:DNA-binding HxlR family transcriptional regulator